MGQAQHTYKELDIDRVKARHFAPETPNGSTFVIQSATGVVQGIYTKFAGFLAENGYEVYTYDYPGIGDSRPKSLKGFACTPLDWAMRDAPAVLAYAQKQHPQNRLNILGHSIGGQIIGLNEFRTQIDGIVHITTQSGYWGHWPFPKKYLLAANWYTLFPGLSHLFGYFPGKKLGAMEDLPKGVAVDWAKWCRSPGYLFDNVPQAKAQFAEINVPLIAFSFTDDTYAPGDSVKWMLGNFSGCAITHRHCDPQKENLGKVGHFGFFKSRQRDKLWNDLIIQLAKWH